MKGLICSIFRSSLCSSSNHGISSRHTEVLLVPDPENLCDFGIPQIFDESPDRPTVVLRTRMVSGIEYLRAVPIELSYPGCWSMMGGCFIYTCDSRFPSAYPIPLHDRVEP